MIPKRRSMPWTRRPNRPANRSIRWNRDRRRPKESPPEVLLDDVPVDPNPILIGIVPPAGAGGVVEPGMPSTAAQSLTKNLGRANQSESEILPAAAKRRSNR